METETTKKVVPPWSPGHLYDVADAAPLYSLSKMPDTTVRRYEHDGNWLDITPSAKGPATIYDKDILIYCISQVMAQLKAGEPISQCVWISAYDLLTYTNRSTDGRAYSALMDALDRLEGTRIRIIRTGGGAEQIDGFIDAPIRRKQGTRLVGYEIKLSDWVFDAIRAQEVLTLHRDYFRLRKPIDRRLYEIARKHCGQQDEWRVDLTTLLAQTGAQSPLRRFRQMIWKVASQDLLDYSVSYDAERDLVTFRNSGSMAEA